MDSTLVPDLALGVSATACTHHEAAGPSVPAGSIGQALASFGSDDSRAPGLCRRLLLTLLFTDIVGSTRLVERLGDHAWHGVLRRHRGILRAQLVRSGGVEIDCCGDSFFAIFPGPALAIQFAAYVSHALREIGIQIRAGVHAGECDFEEGGRVSGIAVHVAARIASVARPGEILVSDTVRDLVAGSDLGFADRGRRTLKGVTGSRRLFALQGG